ncbi:MAG: PilZ domain-containing protein [Sphingomonas sp.]
MDSSFFGGDHRHALRKAVRLTGQLRDRGAAKFSVDIVDLSVTGFRAETTARLYEGALVWLTLPGMAGLEAKVAWVDNTYCGCAFTQSLHPAVFERIVALANG